VQAKAWQIILLTTVVLSLASPTSRAQEQEGTPSQSYTTYVVKWYETLDDVAARFNVSKEVLMAFNGMETDKLSRRQKIKIPDNPDAVVLSKPEEAPEGVQEAEDSVSNPFLFPGMPGAEDNLPAIFKNRPEVCLMLPLNASSTDPDEGSYEFYSGALLAIKDLSSEGINTELKVLDVKSEKPSMDEISDSDLIIGPIAPAHLDTLLGYCPSKVPVISPLDPKGLALTERFPNIIQAPTPFAEQYPAVIDWLKEELQEGDRVILLMEKGTTPTPLFDHLSSSDITYSLLEYGILEGRQAIDRITGMMTPDAVNRVLIASDNEAFVNDAVRNINLMKFKGFETTLYSTSRIRGFDTIEVENLHNIHARVVVTYYVDYNSPAVQRFIMSYRALFSTEPSPFAFQGYDATRFFVKSFSSQGGWMKRIHKTVGHYWRGLQSDFLIKSNGEGYANSAVRRIIYDDSYKIVLQ